MSVMHTFATHSITSAPPPTPMLSLLKRQVQNEKRAFKQLPYGLNYTAMRKHNKNEEQLSFEVFLLTDIVPFP